MVDDRTQASLEAYYRQFTPEEQSMIEAIAMDIWEPYIQARHACVPDAATKIVFETSRAWAIQEALRPLWRDGYPMWAEKYFKAWYFRATHSRLDPIIAAAKTLKRQLANLLTYFKHRLTNATTEGIHSKIQTLKLMACGYRNRKHYKTAICLHCGGLDLYPGAEGV